VYTSTPAGAPSQIVSVRADGTDPRPLTSSVGGNRAPDVSPDGERIAYVAGKVAEAGKGKSQLSLRIQALAPRSTPVLVPLHPGEQVLSPSF
jgi:Tol biopolymer transport system component